MKDNTTREQKNIQSTEDGAGSALLDSSVVPPNENFIGRTMLYQNDVVSGRRFVILDVAPTATRNR